LKILFDQGTPAPLRHALVEHTVGTAFEQGWQTLQNGQLLAAAEAAGFDVLVTTDQNLRYQQNLAQRRLAILVLSTTNWKRIRQHVRLVVDAVAAVTAGQYVELSIPEA
jgi:predicted nuclease of predicted toxin-antitoxin system